MAESRERALAGVYGRRSHTGRLYHLAGDLWMMAGWHERTYTGVDHRAHRKGAANTCATKREDLDLHKPHYRHLDDHFCGKSGLVFNLSRSLCLLDVNHFGDQWLT
jgi:hypothetical protein